MLFFHAAPYSNYTLHMSIIMSSAHTRAYLNIDLKYEFIDKLTSLM
jgi:hypothetical protein